MSPSEPPIPFERQTDQQATRSCGAACLSMVYRSFGKDLSKEVSPEEIWPAISKINRFGSLASTTHLMTQDALKRGFGAVAFQARHALQVLRLSSEGAAQGIRVILNHRLRADSASGHYSVLTHFDERHVILHDPLLGPSRERTHAELLELWAPNFANSEIVGNVLIAITAQPAAPFACEFCHEPIPAKVVCPKCRTGVSLHPSALLGCFRNRCIARMWNYICCPNCDHLWDARAHALAQPGGATTELPNPAVARAAPQADTGEPDFAKMFAALDRFVNFAMTIPGAANHAQLKTHLDVIRGARQQIPQAMAEDAAHMKARADRVEALKQAAKQREEARRKQKEKLEKAPPPLDGDALGRALRKNLGFTTS
jgi:predicted double-glycine peptidase